MPSLYEHTEAIHNLVAPRAVVPIVTNLLRPRSVLDVGCGTGTWLSAFAEQGVADYLGVDGDHVDLALLKIPPDRFLARDLRRPLSLGRRFDLVLSLEVAEHLDERFAGQFVRGLVDHGDTILFSAAVPGQGGQHHVNEQWPTYWRQKFEAVGYHFHDSIRPLIWHNEAVDWWYRQNMFLVTRDQPSDDARAILSVVHPALFERTLRDHASQDEQLLRGERGLRISARIFFNALRFKARSLLRR